MTAGNMYTIAGSPTGNFGRSQDGTPASQSLLLRPANMAVDPSGNLFIADTGNNRVVEIAKVSGQNRGNGTMTVNDMYTIAGNPGGTAGHCCSGNNAAQNSFLNDPVGLSFGSGNADLYIADAGNNRVEEVPATSGTHWGQSMTANDIYTVAGNVNGTAGTAGDGGASTAAFLTGPTSVVCANSTQLYIADSGNNRIQEV